MHLRFFVLTSCLLGLPLLVHGQQELDPAAGPRVIVTTIFDAMRRADTTGLRGYFLPEATLHSIVTNPEGAAKLHSGNLNDWFVGIASAKPGDWDERTPYTEVRQDGALVTAWVPYVFYYAGELHHCGTNAFQLVLQNDHWRVLHITDTRRDAEGDCRELPSKPANPVVTIDSLASRWHRAAARADSVTYFDLMATDSYYLGTDKTEHWTKEQFLAFAAPYFARGKAWSFRATERHVFYDEDRQLAWWDEVLHTWMGPCRGVGVVERNENGEWRIRHYTLSMLVPNERMQAVLGVLGG